MRITSIRECFALARRSHRVTIIVSGGGGIIIYILYVLSRLITRGVKQPLLAGARLFRIVFGRPGFAAIVPTKE